MKVLRAIGRNCGPKRRAMLLLTTTLSIAGLLVPSSVPTGDTTDPSVSVIVRELEAVGDAPERAVAHLGGRVGRQLGIIDGFVADIPAPALQSLRSVIGVHSVTPNEMVTLAHQVDGYNAHADAASLFHVTRDTIGAAAMWEAGYSGEGVDVAVIDSGVVPVNGLTALGKVVNGPDLSYEGGEDALRHLDTFGHGTHMAGIIAGRDDDVATPVRETDPHRFIGVAPDAGIVNIKVANAMGATDVSQVIAAIDWVVEHRNDNGLNIRVLNLSFGTDGVQDYRLDPLAHAAEVAWRKGIVVVVAAGNEGYGDGRLNNPAYDPYILAVGGTAANGTADPGDDSVPAWSSRGDGTRNPDLVAPGTAVVSLRDPASHLDLTYPEAQIGTRFFRGSGTSQAAAVVSGAAALIIQQRPDITPDQVKGLLTGTARPLPHADALAQGAGMIDLAAARDAATPSSTQGWDKSLGTGSLDDARGSAHVEVNDTTILGEEDVFGSAWNSVDWLGNQLLGTTWSGGDWSGRSWAGASWSGGTWLGNGWTGNWSGNTWSGNTWSGNTWSGNTWSGNTWSGNTWSGNTWSTANW